MNEQRPETPEIVDPPESDDNGGNSTKTMNPTPDALGSATDFPLAALAALKDGQQQLDAEGTFVGVSRQAVDEVLSWIDRYVPIPVRTAEDAVVVEGIKVLTVHGDDFLDEVDLIRCNGRPFVPEPPAAVIEPPEGVAGWLRLAAMIKPPEGLDAVDEATLYRKIGEAFGEGTLIQGLGLYHAEDAPAWRAMLVEAAKRFREYEQLHVAKIKTGDDPAIHAVNRDALDKAKADAEIAARIETLLADWPS